MQADTSDNRKYIQAHRLWMLGEVVVLHLVKTKPSDIQQAILELMIREKKEPTQNVDPPQPAEANDAKEYLQKNKVAVVVEEWLKALLETKEEHPIDASIRYFEGKLQREVEL